MLKVPGPVVTNAQLGLRLRKKYGLISSSRVGYGMAKKLVSGRIREADRQRMARFFPRWARRSMQANPPDLNYVNWLLWGGDEGRAWSKSQKSKK